MLGSVAFMIIYYGVNTSYIGFYGHNSCTPFANLGTFITAPINYCEDLNPAYNSLSSGVINNMAIPGIFLFVAILYYLLFAQKSKRSIPLWYVIIVAIVSTYLLSGLNLFINSKPAAGTSIIGFDILLFLVISLIIDYIYVSELIKYRTSKTYRVLYLSINHIREKLARQGKPKKITYKEIKVFLGLYILFIFMIIYLLSSYILNKSAFLHMSGGFLLLLSFVLFNIKKFI